MHRFKIVCICSLALFGGLYAPAAAVAQNETAPAAQPSDRAAAAQQSKPGPELEKLNYYVGTWKGEGETEGGPFGPAGKLSSSISCEKFAGGFQVVCRGEERGPTGKRTFLNILAYDEKAKAYTEYGISSFGESEYTTGGSIVGNKRTFVKDLDTGVQGKRIKLRYTEVQVSPTLYTYKAEASKDGQEWTLIAEGKITKVG
ncbi:MAG TPA: DUF1579 family protein [Candidatus Udaeobacter sp.]|nr:DUF1579 family protein [Candidatus Udaeobacter sp.]